MSGSNNKTFTVIGLLIIGILAGVGPFKNAQCNKQKNSNYLQVNEDEKSRTSNQPSFTGNTKSSSLLSDAAYEDERASYCYERAKACLDKDDIAGYNSWKADGDSHSKNANKRRADAEIEKKYDN